MIVSFTSSVLFIAPRNRSGDGWMRKPMRSTKKRGFSVPRISKLQTRLWSRRMATCIIKSFLEIYPVHCSTRGELFLQVSTNNFKGTQKRVVSFRRILPVQLAPVFKYFAVTTNRVWRTERAEWPYSSTDTAELVAIDKCFVCETLYLGVTAAKTSVSYVFTEHSWLELILRHFSV